MFVAPPAPKVQTGQSPPVEEAFVSAKKFNARLIRGLQDGTLRLHCAGDDAGELAVDVWQCS